MYNQLENFVQPNYRMFLKKKSKGGVHEKKKISKKKKFRKKMYLLTIIVFIFVTLVELNCKVPNIYHFEFRLEEF